MENIYRFLTFVMNLVFKHLMIYCISENFRSNFLNIYAIQGLWELAERLGEVRRRGITDDDINRIPTHDFRFEPEGSNEDEEAGAVASDGSGSQCQICLVNFENGDSLRSIPCRHDFHRDCIDEWLKVGRVLIFPVTKDIHFDCC